MSTTDAAEPVVVVGAAVVVVGFVVVVVAVASVVAAAVPVGWWTVALDLPSAVLPGTRVRIVLGEGEGVSGIVVEPSQEDSFGLRSAGLVAVPALAADAVGFAAGAGQIVILFEP